MVDEDEVTPRDGETEKTPCEILKEKMKEARGDEGIAPNQYGGTGCHNGKVLVCVFPEEFVQPGDDPHGAAIASVCISAHEHHHSKQAKYDPDGTGVYPPENDLKCDEAEREALEAEIDCYNSQECPSGASGGDCRILIEAFKSEVCGQYETTNGAPHSSC